MIRALAPSVLLAAAASAAAGGQQPLSGAEFDACTSSRTLTYMEAGEIHGFEQYRPGRQVTWAFLDGQCEDGWWYEREPALICFVCENEPEEQCWTFFDTGNGLRATFMGEEEGVTLCEARRSERLPVCLGPEVGA